MITWRELWAQTEAEVGGRPEARWLCEEASGAFGPEFTEALDEFATERMLAHLDHMLERWRAGEPLQYVLGHWSFRHLDLMVDQRVLIPRPETELVAEVALAHARRALDALPATERVRCADLGTGSGAIGLSLAFELPRGRSEVWLTDVSEDALDVARANAAGLGVAGGGIRFAQGSWFDALPEALRGALHVVVSNPPYIAEGDPAVEAAVHQWEPHTALYSGADGLDAVRLLACTSADWLVPGGSLVLEIGAHQGGAVAQLVEAEGFAPVEVRSDLAGRGRIVVATKK
ncbi:MAG TPA: peptide chain release factor N(5)-glutamine methyltransferase [Acidimicrobiaceae bacterium]|nr:peptide chain release factor N(5)-glutamine methyltransferase [Acidimicrobiaceae bacterium]